MQDGWKIEAQLPRRISPADRLTVLGWFRDYRSTVRRLHPLWVTHFYSYEQAYILEVKPTRNAKELFEKGQNLKGIWTDEIANRA